MSIVSGDMIIYIIERLKITHKDIVPLIIYFRIIIKILEQM